MSRSPGGRTRTRFGSGALLTCAGIALVLGGAAGSASVRVPSFSAEKTYRTGSNGALVGIADLNGDGFPELVALEGRHFSVFVNSGHGTFGAKSDYQTGPRPAGAIADVNGDGKPDLLSANAGNDTVSVLLNRGDGTFAVRQDIAIGGTPHGAPAVADLNGDGKADLVTGTEGGAVSVLLGNGDGTFQAYRDYPVSRGVEQLVATDLNGDGKPDLVSSSDGYDSVSVLLNNGDGTFQPRHEYATAAGDSNSLAVGDMNGDGSPDLVTAESCGCGPGTVTVLINGGDGSFSRRDYVMEGGIIPLFGGPVSATVADLNGDGRPDIVTIDETYDGFPVGISVLLNRGDGTFARHDYAVGRSQSGGASVTIADLNGDGRPELVMSDEDTLFALLLNKGDGTFQARRDYPAPFSLERVAIGDLNGDGRPDLIGTSNSVKGQDLVSVLLNTPGLCNVQDVSMMRPARAKLALARVNCRAMIRRVFDPKRDRPVEGGCGCGGWAWWPKGGLVYRQRPHFGAVLPAGGKVRLVVRFGRRR